MGFASTIKLCNSIIDVRNIRMRAASLRFIVNHKYLVSTRPGEHEPVGELENTVRDCVQSVAQGDQGLSKQSGLGTIPPRTALPSAAHSTVQASVTSHHTGFFFDVLQAFQVLKRRIQIMSNVMTEE